MNSFESTILAIFAMVVLHHDPVRANDQNDLDRVRTSAQAGIDAYNRQDYVAAKPKLEIGCNGIGTFRSENACLVLGLMYNSGHGVVKNYVIALEYFTKKHPIIEKAKKDGRAGEGRQGYILTFVVGDSALDRSVNDINMRRSASYQNLLTEQPQKYKRLVSMAFGGVPSAEKVGQLFACKKWIPEAAVGTKYQSDTGEWMTKTTAPASVNRDCAGVPNGFWQK